MFKKLKKTLGAAVALGTSLISPTPVTPTRKDGNASTTSQEDVDSEVDNETVMKEAFRIANNSFRQDEELIYRTYDIPMFKGSIKMNYTADKDADGNVVSVEGNDVQVTLQEIKPLTAKEAEEVALMKFYGNLAGEEMDRSETIIHTVEIEDENG